MHDTRIFGAIALTAGLSGCDEIFLGLTDGLAAFRAEREGDPRLYTPITIPPNSGNSDYSTVIQGVAIYDDAGTRKGAFLEQLAVTIEPAFERYVEGLSIRPDGRYVAANISFDVLDAVEDSAFLWRTGTQRAIFEMTDNLVASRAVAACDPSARFAQEARAVLADFGVTVANDSDVSYEIATPDRFDEVADYALDLVGWSPDSAAVFRLDIDYDLSGTSATLSPFDAILELPDGVYLSFLPDDDVADACAYARPPLQPEAVPTVEVTRSGPFGGPSILEAGGAPIVAPFDPQNRPLGLRGILATEIAGPIGIN